MVAQCRPLIAVLAEIPDFRKARGKRHPLTAVLALVCAALLCGVRSYSAVAQWARDYDRELVAALGFTHPHPPCAATLHTILAHLDRRVVEAKLTAWAESVLASRPTTGNEWEAIALDGKALRGSQGQGAVEGHLLSALSQRLGVTLSQHAVADKTNEIPITPQVLGDLLLTGRIFTMDALLTQRAIAHAIVDGGGDYVMVVKENQPRLHADIDQVFTMPEADQEICGIAHTREKGHGRLEERRLTASTALLGYSDWPGLAQIFRLERRVVTCRTGEVTTEAIYGATSLPPPRAPAAVLLELVRGHWRIENQSHYVRDVTFGEDHSQVRVGSIPHLMAAFRNTAIGLLRLSGERNIAAATRRLAAKPSLAIALIGITHDY
jgi:predicted transposase YbfD/YdcC